MEKSPRFILIVALGILQCIMFFFTIRTIFAKLSGNDENVFYFREKKDNIHVIAESVTFTTLIVLFLPIQETLDFKPTEIKAMFAVSVLGLLNMFGG